MLAVLLSLVLLQDADSKPRLLVLTDIGGDPDDQQSMIRLMHYANEFELEGLIATASGTPGELKKYIVRPDLIREIVEEYGRVRDNLARHADGYPTAQHLLSRIKSGNPQRGRSVIGEGHDTEASRWIISVVDRADTRPVNISIWGGQTDLAQALWRIRQERGEEGLQQFAARVRIYDIADQDEIVEWMWEQFPGLFYVLGKSAPGQDKREGAFRGLYLGGDESLVSREWMETHIRRGHGPLGALYPPQTWTAPNPYSAIKEGDTPSWFYFLPHGLNDANHPEWGGWGGRYEKVGDRIYRDARDSLGKVTDARTTVSRWRRAFQSDFQARLDRCVSEQANHNPIAILNGDLSHRIVELAARPGETVRLSAAGSEDPDREPTLARWFIYREAGTFRGDLQLSAEEGLSTSFVAPPVTVACTVHVILELQDEGTPRLSAFRRAIINLQP